VISFGSRKITGVNRKEFQFENREKHFFLHTRVGEKNILTIFLGILKKTLLGIPSKKKTFFKRQ